MTAARRTALVSVLAAVGLVTLKLVTAFLTSSLGLFSEAVHSGTDLVAALLTYFAVGLAVRPADDRHQYGHGKAEHLAALGEGAFLVLASLFIAWRSLSTLVGSAESQVNPAWYAFAVVGVVMLIDLSRIIVSVRAARRFESAAFAANALHFGGDFAGTGAVLVGLALARAGWEQGDPAAALLVAVLVLLAAGRLMRRNVDVLMDRAPADAEEAARGAIAAIRPAVDLRRLRMRQAGGLHFADVVIGVAPGAAVGQGHAIADTVEEAVRRALPEADVVVHVEPRSGEALLRERAHEAALGVPRVREVHNVNVVNTAGGTEVSLHLKLPGELSLDAAHAIAEQVERAIQVALPEVAAVHSHLEPLAEEGAGRAPQRAEIERELEAVLRIVHEETGHAPRELRFLATTEGLVAFLTLGLDPHSPLAAAHAQASRIEARIRDVRPEIADVVVHTEP